MLAPAPAEHGLLQVPVENHVKSTKTISASQMATISSVQGPCWSQSTVASPLDVTFVPRHQRNPASQNRPQNAQINSPPKTASAAAPSNTVEGPYTPPTVGIQRPLRIDPRPNPLLMRSDSLRHLTLTSPRIPRVGPESNTFFVTAEEEPHSEGESSATAGIESRISTTTRVQTRLTNQSTAAISTLRHRSPDASSVSTLADAESQCFP